MKIAWDRGFRQVEAECDSAILIDGVHNGLAAISNIDEIRIIHEWCTKDW